MYNPVANPADHLSGSIQNQLSRFISNAGDHVSSVQNLESRNTHSSPSPSRVNFQNVANTMHAAFVNAPINNMRSKSPVKLETLRYNQGTFVNSKNTDRIFTEPNAKTLSKDKVRSPSRNNHLSQTMNIPQKTDENLIKTRTENNLLRDANRELNNSIMYLNKELLNLKSRPATVEVKSGYYDPDLKLTEITVENDKLKTQLRDKMLEVETLKLEQSKLRLDMKSKTTDYEGITSELRLKIEAEIRPRIEDQYFLRIKQLNDELNEKKTLIDDLNTKLLTSRSDIERLEDTKLSLTQSHRQDVENLRQQITNDLWGQYETKITGKQVEYEQRITNATDEIGKLTRNLNEWRSKCSDAESRAIELLNQLDNKALDEMNLRKEINQSEQGKFTAEQEFEKSRQIILDKGHTIDQLKTANELVESQRKELLARYEKLEYDYGSVKAKSIALSNDNTSVTAKNNALKADLDRKINELGENQVKILKMESDLKVNNAEVDYARDKLHDNYSTIEKLRSAVMNLESDVIIKEGGFEVLEEVSRKLKLQLGRNEQENLDDKKKISSLKGDLFDLQNAMKNTKTEHGAMSKNLDAVTNNLTEKEVYCKAILDENNAYKRTILNMNQAYNSLEVKLHDQNNQIQTVTRDREEKTTIAGIVDDDRENWKRRYIELEAESLEQKEALNRLNSEFGLMTQNYVALENLNVNTELQQKYSSKENADVRQKNIKMEQEVKQLQQNSQEIYYLRAEKEKLLEQIDDLKNANSKLQLDQARTTEDKYRINAEDAVQRKQNEKYEHNLTEFNEELEMIRRERESNIKEIEHLKGDLALWRRKAGEYEKNYDLAMKKADQADLITDQYKKTAKESMDIWKRENTNLRDERDKILYNNEVLYSETNQLRESLANYRHNVNDSMNMNFDQAKNIMDKEKIIFDLQSENQNLVHQTHKDIMETYESPNHQIYSANNVVNLSESGFKNRNNSALNVAKFESDLNTSGPNTVLTSGGKMKKAPSKMTGSSLPNSQNIIRLENVDISNYPNSINNNYGYQQDNILHSRVHSDSNPQITFNDQSKELEKIKNEIQFTFENMKHKYNK